MELSLVGGSNDFAGDPSISQRTVNLYPRVSEAQGRSAMQLTSTEGITAGGGTLNGPVRAMLCQNGTVLFVAGQLLYEYTGTLPLITRGVFPALTNGRMQAASNETWAMFIDDDGLGYTYEFATNTLAVIADPDFPAPIRSLTYTSGYFVVAPDDNSREFYISLPNDPTQWDGLDFARKDGDGKAIRAVFANHGDLAILGEGAIEYWNLIPNGDFPFQKLEGAERDTGCIARFSVAESGDQFFFVGDDRSVYMVTGYIPQRVSHHALEQELRQLNQAEAEAIYSMGWTREGHHYYSITTPLRTYVYDYTVSQQIGQNIWFERTTSPDFNIAPWNVNHIIDAYGDLIYGNAVENELGFANLNGRTEYGVANIAYRQTSIINGDVNNIAASRLELRANSSILGSLVTMETSRDGGGQFGVAKTRFFDRLANGGSRAIWRRLGSALERVFRFSTNTEQNFTWIALHGEGREHG